MNEQELWFCERLARRGVDFDEIPRAAGIKRREWRRYFRENPGERQRFIRLRAATDFRVEDALLKRALGYKTEEIRKSGKNGEDRVTTTKEVAPDVRAALEWLKCRSADWRSPDGGDAIKRVRDTISRLDEEAFGCEDEC